MKHLITIFSITFLLLQAQLAHSQIVLNASMTKQQYVAYEAVKLNVTMTNRAGRPIQFANKYGEKWVEFVVRRSNKDSVFTLKDVVYKPVRLNTGETRTSTFTLNNSFDVSQTGNYSAYAIVRMPGQGTSEGVRSKKVFFTVVKGIATWKQRAGVPGTAGDTREFRILNVTNGHSELYVQVEDVKRNKVLATYSMGKNLSFRKYSATLDNKNRMHILFLTKPTIFSHTVVDSRGKTVRREYHKKGPGGRTPRLITTNSGVVGVMNSTRFNPEKMQEARLKIHNLSELPLGL